MFGVRLRTTWGYVRTFGPILTSKFSDFKNSKLLNMFILLETLYCGFDENCCMLGQLLFVTFVWGFTFTETLNIRWMFFLNAYFSVASNVWIFDTVQKQHRGSEEKHEKISFCSMSKLETGLCLGKLMVWFFIYLILLSLSLLAPPPSMQLSTSNILQFASSLLPILTIVQQRGL